MTSRRRPDDVPPSRSTPSCRSETASGGFWRLSRRLSDPRWEVRLEAIEEILATRDVRFETRLWLLGRFHLAPSPVRSAARRVHRILRAHRQARCGQLSPPAEAESDPGADEKAVRRAAGPRDREVGNEA